MRRGIWMLVAVAACVLATLGAGNPPSSRPELANTMELTNEAPPLPSGGLCERPALLQAPLSTLAIVVVPGPLNSARVSFEIWNYASDSISAVNIDGFDALGGQGLLFNKVTPANSASVGSLRIEYPQSGVDGRGPIVLRFDGFARNECVAVDSEASTWGQTLFRGRVMDAVGARIQVVFEGGLRGSGEVVLCGSNSRFARDIPCHPGDAVAVISGSRTMQVRLSN